MAVAKKDLSKKEISTIYLQREMKHLAFIKNAKGELTDVPNKLAGEKYFLLTYTDDKTSKEVVFTTDNKRFIKDYDKGQLAEVIIDIETTGTGANAVTYANLGRHLSSDKKLTLAINSIKERRIAKLELDTQGDAIDTYSLKELQSLSIN